MKHPPDAAAAMRARCALRARSLHRNAAVSGGGCVVELSHGSSSFAQRGADAAALCAGHKKARSDPPGRDTHSYDDGLNTQDSVTQVNAFSAISHAPAGAIIAISQIGCSLGLFLLVPLGGCLDPRRLILCLLAAAPGRRRSDIARRKR
jgi:hypothetical protein